MPKQDINADPDSNIQSVPDRTISRFLEILSEDQEYKDISERLQKELIIQNKVSEPSIRLAVFGGEE